MTNTALDLRRLAAPSVSRAAREKLEWLAALISAAPPSKPPETLQEFDAAAATAELVANYLSDPALSALSPTIVETRLGGVPVLDVTPPSYVDDGSLVVYVHGGGFVRNSARSSLLMSALIASTTGRKVVSVDYTLAPRGTCVTIVQEVIDVWSALLETHDAKAMGLMGDSAGGTIAASVTHALRNRSLAVPAALVLLSPATDLTGAGDTHTTLAAVDYLNKDASASALRAYAGGLPFEDARLSPLFGEFARGYPPVLLQVGTREILLSDSVRLHRALRAHGVESQLDVYEGMPHVFQSLLADTPEGVAAWSEMRAFWARHLASRV